MKDIYKTIIGVFIAIAFLIAPGTASGWTPPSYVQTNTPFFLPAPTANNTTGWQIKNFGPVGIGIKIKSPGWTMEIINVEPGSPAASTGTLAAGQIIESINGVTLTGVDPRVVLGKLITDAEASNGIISLQIKNVGPVVVTIPVMGSYSATWPLNCPKSDLIVRNLANRLIAQGQNEWGSVLFLLSTGDANDLAVVRGWMQNRASFATNTWSIGYEGIGVAEYYLRTGDPVVLPLMQEAADKLRDTIYAGGWSGRGASFNYNSGGHMNAAGVPALTFLLLAKTCGINVDSATLESSLRHFYRFAGTGGVPYGDYTPKSGFNDDNGKTGNLALAMAAASRLTPDGENSVYAQAAQRCATKFFYGVNDYCMGHTGGGIGEIWKSVSMGLMTEKLPAQYRSFMDARWWILELSRRHNGGIGVAGGSESNYDKATGETQNGWGTLYALNYTLPRKNLHLFGAPLSPWAHSFTLPARPWGTAADDAFRSFDPVPGGPWTHQDMLNEVPNLHSGKAVSTLLGSTTSDQDILTYLHHPELTYRNDAIWAILRTGKDSMLSYMINSDDARLQHIGVMALHEILGTWRTGYKNPSKVTPAMWARIEALIRDAQTSWFVKQWALGLLQHVDTATLKTYTSLFVTLADHEEYWLRGGVRSLSPKLIADPETYATIFPPVLNAYVDSVPFFEVTGASALKTGLDMASPAIKDSALQLLIPAYINMPQELVSELGKYVIPDGGEIKRKSFGQVFGFSAEGQLFVNTRPKKTSAWKVSGNDADLYTWNGTLQANPAVHGMWEYISYTLVKDEAAAIALIQQGLANNTIPLSTVTTYGRGFNIASDGTVAPKGDYPNPMRYSGNMAFGTYIDRAYQFKIVTVYGRKYLMMEDEFITERDPTVEEDVGSDLDPTYQTSYMVFANVNIADTIPPEIITLSPADNALGVAGAANLEATFSESIAKGTGNITLKNLTDGTQTLIPVTDAQVTISGRVLTINPTADLMAGKNYAVQIASTAVKDLANNNFAGIANDTTWNFAVLLPLYSSGAKTWNATTTNWGTVTGGPYNTTTWSSGAAAILEGTAGNVELGEAISLRNLTFTHTTGTYTITGSALNFTGGTITGNDDSVNGSTNGVTISSNITGAPAINLKPVDGDDQFTLKPAASGSMIIGAVSGDGGNGSEKLNLQGGAGSSGTIASSTGPKLIVTAGAWTLNGAATGYGHSISAGTLTLNANVTATNRSVTLSGTGVINYNVANAVSPTAATPASGSDNGFRLQTGATLDQTSGVAINTSSTNPSMTWEGNWTFIGTNGALSNLNLGTGNVFLKAASPQVTVQNAATTLTVGGHLFSPVNGLTKAGAGTLRLTGNGTYGGVTTITAGTLSVSTISNGGFTPTLTTTANSATVTASSTAGLVVGQTVGSNNVPVGATIASIVNGTTFTINSGTGVLAGTSAASSIGTASSLGTATSAATNLVFNGGTLKYTGANATSNRAFTINAGKTATIETDNDISFAGATGAATTGALTKTGAGKLTLDGVNTYTGNTTVTGGTLSVTGSLGATAVSVNAGTLSGNGNFGGNVTIASGATHSLAVAATAAAQDTSAITGTLAMAGSILNLTATSTPAPGVYVLATATVGITGTPATINTNGISGTVSVDTASSPKRLLLTVTGGDPFASWAGSGGAFDADANGDGVDNGMAWVLGATDKNANAIPLLPTMDNTSDPDFFIFTYRRDDDANTDPKTAIKAEYGSMLSGWITAVAGPDIIITPTNEGAGAGIDLVQVKIRRTLAVGGKLFVRLSAVNTP